MCGGYGRSCRSTPRRLPGNHVRTDSTIGLRRCRPAAKNRTFRSPKRELRNENNVGDLRMTVDYLFAPAAFMRPDRVVQPLSWAGHIPFAFWLVAQIRPKVLVELGTHTGNSYFAFCQSVAANRLSTRCHAVDTWQGDEQAGSYDDGVYAVVSEYNDAHFRDFSRLHRSTFDMAASE